MKKGLVFCGGGAKGSYELGVWKLLDEIGEKFDIVCGTSIGCLNAAMYAQNEYDRCSELWGRITLDLILKKGFEYDENVAIKISLKQREDLLSFLSNYIKYKGGNVKPLMDLMDEYIDEEKIKNSNVTLGIVTTQFPSFKPVEVSSRDLDAEYIKKYMLASVSAFPIFPVCKIDDASYIDGGYYDNLPINFCIELGATEVVAVDLNPNATHKEFLNKPYIKYIKPYWNLGGFLKFDHDVIEKNFKLGYNDACKAYGKKMGFKYTFYNMDSDIIEARKFTIFISKIVGFCHKNKIKTNVKPEQEGDLFYILEKPVPRPLTDLEYFIRSVEVAAEFYGLEYYSVYRISEIFQQIVDKTQGLEDNNTIFDGYQRLKSINKKKDFISRIDDKILLKYLYNKELNHEEFEVEFLANILASKPVVMIIYYLLKVINE